MLYFILSPTEAYQYPISVGREGFSWTGTEVISRKQEWPDWHPPEEMIARDPRLPDKMTGGIKNPLGAMALYLGNTLYRIHGTNDPKSIGRAASSGCFRMLNEHVLHLATLAGAGHAGDGRQAPGAADGVGRAAGAAGQTGAAERSLRRRVAGRSLYATSRRPIPTTITMARATTIATSATIAMATRCRRRAQKPSRNPHGRAVRGADDLAVPHDAAAAHDRADRPARARCTPS